MGVYEWLRYHNTVDYIRAVENPEPCPEDDGESYNPESEWYISPEERVRHYEHAKREAEIMKKLHFDDMHRDFGQEPAWYHKPEVLKEQRREFEWTHPKFVAEWRAKHGVTDEEEDEDQESLEACGQADDEEEQTGRGGFFGWLFGK